MKVRYSLDASGCASPCGPADAGPLEALDAIFACVDGSTFTAPEAIEQLLAA